MLILYYCTKIQYIFNYQTFLRKYLAYKPNIVSFLTEIYIIQFRKYFTWNIILLIISINYSAKRLKIPLVIQKNNKKCNKALFLTQQEFKTDRFDVRFELVDE